jgi:MoxR-like ATPase
VASWLAARLGVREALSPPRLTRVVQAFEAQVETEKAADDLDYDDSGRLQFRSDLGGEVGDAKGAAQALRMTYTRKRRYGATHVGARVRQVDELVARVDGYLAELSARLRDLAAYRAQALWMDEALAVRAEENLTATVAAVTALRERAGRARQGFEALPRLAADPGTTPEPVAHDPLAP